MYAHVIPTIRIPAHVSERYYTYIVPQELKETLTHGMVVEVPFRKRKVQGIVIKTVSRNTSGVQKDKLQTISRLLHPESLLTKEQIQLANYLVRSAQVSYPLAYKTLLPEIPKKSTKTKTPPSSLRASAEALTKEEKQGSRNPSTSSGNKKIPKERFVPPIAKALNSKSTYILHYTHTTERENLIAELAKKLDPNQQLLIVVPELEDLPYMAAQLKNYEISTITSKLTKTTFFGQYKTISSGRVKIVLGTRKALFMPFYSLGAICIAQAHSESLKSLKQKPHYTTLDIADFLRIAHQCPVFLATHAPTLEMWNQIQNKDSISISQQTSNFQLPTSKLVDMTEEFRKEHFSPISDELRKKIKNLLPSNSSNLTPSPSDIFIFHNRKGYSTLISCKKCEYTFECPNCHKPLVSHVGAQNLEPLQENAKLQCGTCGYTEDMPPLCPECNNPDFFFRGKGTQKIAALLAKEFPEAKVIRLDKDVKKLPPKTSPLTPRIIVGTIFALPRIDWSRIALVGVINLDPMLVLPDPEAHMRVYQILRRIQSYTSSNFQLPTSIIIQTYSPSLPIYQAIVQNKPDIFYTHEEEIKKSLRA